MWKYIQSDSQERLVTDVGLMLQVWEDRQHIKQAASPLYSREDILEFAPPRGKFLSHSVTLGAHELYGPNRNHDSWRNDELMRKHATFLTHAKVYREHKNQKPEYAIGEIKSARYCPKLGRGEVLFWTDIEKAAKEFERARKGEVQHTSMAANVEADKCTACNYISKVAHQRCSCIRHRAGQYIKSAGAYALMDNINPTFKDQSFVERPADRIAHTMDYLFDKAASTGAASTGAASTGAASAEVLMRGDEMAAAYGNSPIFDAILSIHQAMDSDNPHTKAASQWVWPRAWQGQYDEDLVTRMKGHAWPARVFASLQKRAMVMPLATFSAYLNNTTVHAALADPTVKEASEKMAQIRGMIIARISKSPGFALDMHRAAEEFAPASCCCEDAIDQVMDKARDQFSLRYEALTKRAVTNAPRLITVTGEPSSSAFRLGAAYNAYLAVQKLAHESNPEILHIDGLLAALH
jgi:hypothetical protein